MSQILGARVKKAMRGICERRTVSLGGEVRSACEPRFASRGLRGAWEKAAVIVGVVICGALVGIPEALSEEGGQGYAVLVGINQYRASTADPLDRVTNLEQTVNDVRKIQAFLPKVGFSPERIKVLVDEEATKEAVLGTLRWMSEAAGRSDRVLFYFSGHGYPISASESSLVMHDTYRRANATHLTGTEFRAWAATLKTQKALFLFDACHSGGLFPKGARGTECPSRGGRDKGARVRYLPNPELKQELAKQRARGGSKAAFRIEPIIRKSIHLSWSASQSHQYACESGIEQGGIFTHLLLRGAESLLTKPQATFLDLSNAILGQLNAAPYKVYRDVQTPRLIGDSSRAIFFRVRPSASTPPPTPTVEGCRPQSTHCIRLWAAASKDPAKKPLLRLTIGSRVKLYFQVTQRSIVRLFLQPTDAKTRTILDNFKAEPGIVYAYPLAARRSFSVVGPPGLILLSASARTPGFRGDLIESDEPDEPQRPPKFRPARAELRLMAVSP